MRPIDLRSDTVTSPSDAMRAAMAAAEVGDDWYGDDPTVNRLQERAAELTGHEAAIYCASGTMATQIALHILVRSGHLAVCEADAHVCETESSASAVLSGIAYRRIPARRRGMLEPDQIAAALAPDPFDVDITDLVCLENTHLVGGGSAMTPGEMADVVAAAKGAGVPVYLDGARVFNAAVATGADVSAFGNQVDAMMFCLSKGLGAPIGSMLCGPSEFIREARRVRILFGGGWRQDGIMAAAGLVALEEGPKRLHEDHERARRLADEVAGILPGSIDPGRVETNIVFVDVEAVGMPLLPTIDLLADKGVRTVPVAGKLRMVTHVDIDDDDVKGAIAAWREVAEEVG
jgi:threonine aldolase